MEAAEAALRHIAMGQFLVLGLALIFDNSGRRRHIDHVVRLDRRR